MLRADGTRGVTVSVVYFAHSYRERDADVVDFFARLIRSEGLTVSLDPPSDHVNAAKLQRHLNASDGMVAVLSKREEGTSAHVLFEITLAIRCGKPILVYVEDTIDARALPPGVSQQRFSLRWYLREVRDHRHTLESFKRFLNDYAQPQFRPSTSRRTCVLESSSNLPIADQQRVASWIEAEADYDVQLLRQDITPYEAWAILRNANVGVSIVDERRSYLNGLLTGIGLPIIELTTYDGGAQGQSWPPAEYQPIHVAPDGAAVSQLLSTHFRIYEEDFLDLTNQQEVDRYATLLVDLGGSYSNLTNQEARKIVMGDNYEGQGVGAMGPNAHVHDVTFNQKWNSFAERNGDDPFRLAEELETLRLHLRKTATTRDEDAAVAEVGAAAAAAEKGDRAKALEHLSRAGKWAWSAATMIGTALAAAALKAAMGM
jgi:hypothetical protein